MPGFAVAGGVVGVVAGGVVGVVAGGVVGVVAGGVVGVVAGGVVGVVAGGVVGVVAGGVVGVAGSCDPDGSAGGVVVDEDLQAAKTSSAAMQSFFMPMVSHRVPPFTSSGTILTCASFASTSRKRS